MKVIKLLIVLFIFIPNICLANIDLTFEEMLWIEQNPVIILAVDDTYAPLNFRNNKGKLEGLSIDYVNIIAKKIGIEIKLEGSIWPEALQKALDHKVDGIVNASPLENRKPFLNFTTSYTLLPQGLVTIKNAKKINQLDELIGLKICAKRNTSHLNLIKQISTIKIIEIDTLEEGLGKVLTGEAFGIFDDVSALGFLVQKYNFSNLKMNWVHYDKSIGATGLGLRNDDHILLSIINKAIDDITTQEHKHIQSSWLMNPDTEIVHQTFDLELFLKIFIPIILFILIGIILFILHNKRLNKVVEEKTKDLIDNEQILYETNRLAKVGGFNLETNGKTKWTKELYYIYEIPPDEEIFFENIAKEFHSHESEKLELFNDTLMNKKKRIEIELEFVTRKTKTKKWERVVATPILDENNEVIKITGASQDITDLKNSEIDKNLINKQLLQSRKMESIGTLAAGIAHDFNNILFIMMSATQILQIDLENNKYLTTILKAGKRGTKLIKQILSFSRQVDQELLNIDIKPIIKETIKLSRSTIPVNIEIKSDIDNDEFIIFGDPTQIHQIILNLITNAYHAVESIDGKIKVSLKNVNLINGALIKKDLHPGDYIHITITDNGCGIEPNHLEKIFEPYFTTKENGKGTGLGLSVVYGIVKDYGGDIIVYSEVGKGTTVNIYIPSSKEKAEITTDDCIIKLNLNGNENVLIIDDEPNIVNVEIDYFNNYGYNAIGFSSPVKALEEFKKKPDFFDIVITDMAMPILPGNKLSNEIHKIRPEIPIIMCSGFSEKMSTEKYTENSVQRYLMKPVDIIKLIQNVRDLLDKTC